MNPDITCIVVAWLWPWNLWSTQRLLIMWLTDSIYSPGQEIMTSAALRNCDWVLSESPCRGICLHVGWHVEIKAQVLAWICNMFTLMCFIFPNPHLHHLTFILGDIFGIPPQLFKMPWPFPPFTNILFRDLLYQLLQPPPNSTCINIRVYSFSACSRKPLRSATCFPASCSPSCTSTSSHCFVLFMSQIELPLPSSRAKLDLWLPLDCSIQHPGDPELAPLILSHSLFSFSPSLLFTCFCPVLFPEVRKMLSPIWLTSQQTDSLLQSSCDSLVHSVQTTARSPTELIQAYSFNAATDRRLVKFGGKNTLLY